jgi:phage terminase small subunit
MAGTPIKLTPKQARFVEEYLKDLNAAQAAIRAGYSAKTARAIAHENLRKPEIAAAVEKAMADRAERKALTADWVVDELRKLAGANMADYMRSTPQGDPYLDFSSLTRDQTAALAEVTVEDFVDDRGKGARAVKRVKFKLHDKRAALVDLGRHLGLFEPKRKHDGKVEVVTNVREFIISRIERLAASRRVRSHNRGDE